MRDNEQARIEAVLNRDLPRREFLQLSAFAGASAGLAAFLAACNPSSSSAPAATETPAASAASSAPSASVAPSASAAAGRTIKLGYVSPKTGPLAGFGEADDYILGGVRATFANGISIGSTVYPVEIVTKDTQSDSNRAAEVAGSLILDDKVDLMLVASTPETTNPVADQCEANGVPCISTVAPWQPWFFARQKDPANPKPLRVDVPLLLGPRGHHRGLPRHVEPGVDQQGRSAGSTRTTATATPGATRSWDSRRPSRQPGYKLTDPGRYQDLTRRLHRADRGLQEGQRPDPDRRPDPAGLHELLQAGRPAGLQAEGRVRSARRSSSRPRSRRSATSARVSRARSGGRPTHPFASSLTGASAKDLADGYTTATKKQWTQPIGFAHALFEVAATPSSERPTSTTRPRSATRSRRRASTRSSARSTGPSGKPFPNIAKTPLVGGQWRKGTSFPYDLVIVSNKDHPDIPAGGQMKLIGG